jgi:2,3-bisphosphoglycerate-independent phosphoglycerate mutase
MKRVALLVDAAADLPYPELQDLTPLQQARLPAARELAAEGRCGALRRMRPEADASRALLAECCGLTDPQARDLRWGPVAAASLGLPLNAGRMYVLAGFVQVDENQQQHPVHPSSLEEQAQLLTDLQVWLSKVDSLGCRLHHFSLGRFVLELHGVDEDWPLSQVQYARKLFIKRLPARLQTLLDAAKSCLQDHPVNQVRLDLGEAPIEGLWCWSGGSSVISAAPLPFRQALVSPDPLAAGMAGHWHLPFLKMEDPYALDRPDAAFDVFEMIKLLENQDEVVIWIPAPFSSRKFEGSSEKVRRLDAVDYYVTGPVKAILEEMQEPSRFLLLAAGVRHRGRPVRGAAPFVLWGEGLKADACPRWTEIDSLAGSLGTPRVIKLLEIFRKET